MKLWTPGKIYSYLLVIGGGFGLAASTLLTVEKIFLLEDPNYKLSCSINEIFACGSIVTTEQASVFGFANSVLGVIAFSILLILGVLAIHGISLPRYFKHAFLVGLTLAHLFVLWLIYQSLYVIGALCPWCMVVWIVTIPLHLWLVVEYGQGTALSRRLTILGIAGWFSIISTLIWVRFYF